MAQIQSNRTKIEISRNQRVTFDERTALFGLVKWWRVVKRERIADDLIIYTDVEIDNIYLNGEPLTKLNTKEK